jgi:hypothetical protein
MSSETNRRGLVRYWFTFQGADPTELHSRGVRIGCGVSGYSLEDALHLLAHKVFADSPVPPFEVIEGIDVSTLDAGHVLPNLSPSNRRGIWFPEDTSRR